MPNVAQLMQEARTLAIMPLPTTDGGFGPTDIRLGIQALAAQGQMELAQALCDAGLTLHPESEDLLAMAGLMALTRGDWGDATVLLEQLLSQQGTGAPAMTYRMLVRSLRCNLEPARAQRVLCQGLQAWPQDTGLQEEREGFVDEQCLMPAPRVNS